LADKGVSAGKKILREDPRQQKVLESELRKRQYMNDGAEHTREVHLSRVFKKDHHYYRGTETVWNEHTRLSPKYHQYSMNSHKFKKWGWGARDFDKIKEIEKKDEY
jgi:hypothetical protein